MRIIEITALPNGAHRNQSWDSSVLPEGCAVIPDGMNTPSFPFGDIMVEVVKGVPTVTKWIPREMPEPGPEVEPEPTTEELVNAMLGVE